MGVPVSANDPQVTLPNGDTIALVTYDTGMVGVFMYFVRRLSGASDFNSFTDSIIWGKDVDAFVAAVVAIGGLAALAAYITTKGNAQLTKEYPDVGPAPTPTPTIGEIVATMRTVKLVLDLNGNPRVI